MRFTLLLLLFFDASGLCASRIRLQSHRQLSCQICCHDADYVSIRFNLPFHGLPRLSLFQHYPTSACGGSAAACPAPLASKRCMIARWPCVWAACEVHGEHGALLRVWKELNGQLVQTAAGQVCNCTSAELRHTPDKPNTYLVCKATKCMHICAMLQQQSNDVNCADDACPAAHVHDTGQQSMVVLAACSQASLLQLSRTQSSGNWDLTSAVHGHAPHEDPHQLSAAALSHLPAHEQWPLAKPC